MTPRQIFLIDGMGALLSAFFLGIVLPHFQHWIGMPLAVLKILASLAVGLSCYSLGCFALMDTRRAHYLQRLIAFNLSYCALTLFLTVVYFSSLSMLGLIYFYGEIVIVLALVAREHRILRSIKG